MLVSVIIPSYNRYDSLLVSIQSVLEQTFQDFEIIVIDDCSTDPRYMNGVLEAFPKTTVIHLPVNMRVKHNTRIAAQGKTRDEGIKIAKGKWIAFLDDDDYWYAQKLEIQLYELEKNPHIHMCSSNMNCGKGVYTSTTSVELFHKKDLPTEFNLEFLNTGNYIANSSVLIMHDLVKKVGEFNICNGEDYDYWLRALHYTNCLYISEPLLYFNAGDHVRHYVTER